MSATDKIGWDEVEDAAAKMFNIWVDGNELKWAKEAWRHLAAAGLTGATTILEITATTSPRNACPNLSGVQWVCMGRESGDAAGLPGRRP